MPLEPSRSILQNEMGHRASQRGRKAARRAASGRRRPLLFHGGIAAAFALLVLTLVVVDTHWRGGSLAFATEQSGDAPVVVELFTSHGCYSCPPADALFGELIANNPNLVALEFHVDYWDTLVYGSHGSWKDPFSSPDYSLRQHAYNQQRIAGRRGVYTPQMVVNGRYAAVGSQRRYVEHGINASQRPAINLAVTHTPAADTAVSNGLRITLAADGDGVPDDAHLWLAVFDLEKTTDIPTGENHDKTLTNHHIVRQFEQLSPAGGYAALSSGDTDGNGIVVDTQVTLTEGQGCAVLLQRRSPGPIFGASYCPPEMWKRAG